MRASPQVVVIYEKGAVADVEATRKLIYSCAPLVRINPGFRFDIVRNITTSTPQWLYEEGAIENPVTVERELARDDVAMIEVNKGFRFERLQ